MMIKRLEGRSCIVTGAGRGIGRAIAARLIEEGARVCIADIDEKSAKDAASETFLGGTGALASHVDVADRASVRQMVRGTVDAFGRLDVIFNNAAVAEIKPFMLVTESDWDRLMR